MIEFKIKRGDTSPALRMQLVPTVNLTGATVRFNMTGPFEAPTKVVNRQVGGIVGLATAGVVRYDWRAGDTIKAGVYQAEFEITYSDGTIETFPNGEHIQVSVLPDLS
jgi:hypothetical protein